MTPTLRPDSRHWKSPDHRRGHGPSAVQAAFGCRSLGSAQKKIERSFQEAERVAQVLANQGITQPTISHIARLNDVLLSAPAGEVTQMLVAVGRIGRAEDESREGCHSGGYTRAELELERSRLLAEIDINYAAIRAIDFRVASLP